MEEFFKIRELGVCKKGRIDENTAFTYHEFNQGVEVHHDEAPLNYIIFVLDGQLEIQYEHYEMSRIQSRQMALLLRKSSVHIKAVSDTALYVMYFEKILSSCEQQLLNALLPDIDRAGYVFKGIAIPKPVVQFLKQIHYLQEQQVDCVHFNGLKHRELFILLRHFCPREDFINLMAPVIGSSFNFRNKVLDKFAQTGHLPITEFAGLVGLGRKNFDKKFLNEFGISPTKWMLQEKAKHIYSFLGEPEITIADAMDRFNFNSAAHFNRFCLQHFNRTPGMVIKEARSMKIKDDGKSPGKN